MKVFVTGGGGFLGRHVVRELLRHGCEVVALVRTRCEELPGVHWVEGDLAADCREHLKGADVLVHLAAYGVDPRQSDWNTCFEVNVRQSLALWIKACEVGVTKMIVAGSCFEYGKSGEDYDFVPTDAPLRPTRAYDASKAAATMALHGLVAEKGLRAVLLRPFHVFGEGEAPNRFWPQLRAAALDGRDFPMTPGGQVRDFTPVAQVAADFAKAAVEMKPPAGRLTVRNLGTGTPQTLLEFARFWWGEWGARGSLRPGEVAYRPGEVMRFVPRLV